MCHGLEVGVFAGRTHIQTRACVTIIGGAERRRTRQVRHWRQMMIGVFGRRRGSRPVNYGLSEHEQPPPWSRLYIPGTHMRLRRMAMAL
jgi:hypothetical protein